MAIDNSSQRTKTNTECIVCGAELSLNSSTEIGEIIECFDCGNELEVHSITPLVLIEAPFESEDWGE